MFQLEYIRSILCFCQPCSTLASCINTRELITDKPENKILEHIFHREQEAEILFLRKRRINRLPSQEHTAHLEDSIQLLEEPVQLYFIAVIVGTYTIIHFV